MKKQKFKPVKPRGTGKPETYHGENTGRHNLRFQICFHRKHDAGWISSQEGSR